MIVVYEDSIGKETEFFPESYVKLEDVLKIIKKKERSLTWLKSIRLKQESCMSVQER